MAKRKKRKKLKTKLGGGFRMRAKAAAMARAARKRATIAKSLRVERIKIDRDGYDPRGRYYGTGARLYRVTSATGEDTDRILRASDAKSARTKVAEECAWFKV